MLDPESTILAVASPPGAAPRGIVRVSGRDTRAILGPHLRAGPHSRDAHRSWPRGATLEHLTGIPGLAPAVPTLVITFPAPRSYTGEDVVELHLPGNPDLLDRVVGGLIASAAAQGLPARRAEPGEFTSRAFANGRLALDEAEAVATLVAARSDAAVTAARRLAGGALARHAATLADELTSLLALVEAGIDFTDQEDVVPIAPGTLDDRLDGIERSLRRPLTEGIGLERLTAVPLIALSGAPNAGKSTLFNALLGRDRAIVTATAGTTRDAIIEPVMLEARGQRVEVLLADVAGDDAPVTPLAASMRRAAERARAAADVILQCVPLDAGVVSGSDNERSILVRTKGDLADGASAHNAIVVSAAHGEGLDALRARIIQRLDADSPALGAETMVLAPRHREALVNAIDAIARAREVVVPGAAALAAPELVAAELRIALDAAGVVAGTVTPDDVLGRIFATFCIGK